MKGRAHDAAFVHVVGDQCGASVIVAMDRTVFGAQRPAADDHYRFVLGLASLRNLVRQVRGCHQQPINLELQGGVDRCNLAALVADIQQNRVVVPLLRLRGNEAEEVEMFGVVKVVDQQTDQVRPPPGQDARGHVRAIAESPGNAQHPFARGLVHQTGIGEAARHRGQRHAGTIGDILGGDVAVVPAGCLCFAHGPSFPSSAGPTPERKTKWPSVTVSKCTGSGSYPTG